MSLRSTNASSNLAVGLKEVSVTAPVIDVAHLGADKRRALAGLDVLELDDLIDLAVHLKGLAVSEITGGNGCHSFFLHIPEEITTDFLKFIKYRFLTYGILPHIGPHCK